MKKIDADITTPKGFMACGITAGLKKSGKPDMALIAGEKICSAAAVFTSNKMAAAPVILGRETIAGGKLKAAVVNSGNANACTGEKGLKDARAMASAAANLLGCKENEVLVSSTGVIGVPLNMPKVLEGIEKAYGALSEDGGAAAARAIMTTDTFPKSAAYEEDFDGKKITVAGIAKGSGMIHPDMATMLAYITTDADVAPEVLKIALGEAAKLSFNMAVVDGDTSTNDTAVVMASGAAGAAKIDSIRHKDYRKFFDMLLALCTDLAKLIVKDGEGATKFIEINIQGAASFDDAKMAAMEIAKSPLVKTAFFGSDANWGRIVSAVGNSGAAFDMKRMTVSIEKELIFEGGTGRDADKAKLKEIMLQREIEIFINLAVGEAEATVWTCDLSYDYVKINGMYTT